MSNLFTLNTKLLYRRHSNKWMNRQVAGPFDLPDGLASNPCGTDTGAPINIHLYSVIRLYRSTCICSTCWEYTQPRDKGEPTLTALTVSWEGGRIKIWVELTEKQR